ncbi:hypothetical protein L596_011341 [Steinernema carpocapsae]|uniref:Uncharacterized protein n=1 Tax=Steinernema carpocapsae TaxID=34508 RepID=A0A4U5NTK9_STECR|nr:hypothetical protein L596_011341 [Steinernema carpocapsae]
MNAFVFTFFAFAVIVSLHACSPPPQPAGYPLSSDMTSEIKRLINDRYEEENRQKDPRQLGKRSAEAAIVSVLTDLVEIKNEQTSVVENKIQKSIFPTSPPSSSFHRTLLTNGNVELVFHIQTTYCVHLEDALRSKEIAEVKAIKIITIRCH